MPDRVPERQSARMSKITNDGLTRSSCTHTATVDVKGLHFRGYSGGSPTAVKV